MTERRRLEGRVAIAAALLAGIAAVGVAMLIGVAPNLLEVLATPPPIVRAALAGIAIVVGGGLLLGAIRRIERSVQSDPGDASSLADADLGAMVRGVRLVFLAAASFTAAAGWIVGDPLPLVIALVIGGVDVIETSFLLLVATGRRPGR
jgi:hypothetical protein